MAAREAIDEQLTAITDLLPQLQAARVAAAAARKVLATLELRSGQDCASITVGGIHIPLTVTTARNSYYPELVVGRRQLLATVQFAVREEVIARNSKVEGLEWRLKQLAKGGAA